ncbi:MAG TPA: class I SAM-dependent methyltransferase [Vicinamibacterales bacterium]|nr:class I SAM-dependent methyltransferase [Vicinamibacterales bacterium]
MTLQAWLQERQYATPYHWRQRPNDEREYQLRTQLVLRLARLAGSDDALRISSPRLLDIGCGDARFTADASLRARVVGVDASKRALGHARELAPSARFLASGAAALPFRSNTFDIVTLLDVIEHIPDADESRVIDEAWRVLRPGGRLVVSTNTDRSARELKHFRHYSVARFRSLFDRFERLELAGLIPYFPTLKVWMAAPLVWRLTTSRIRTCAPEAAHVILGAAIKPIID